MSAKPLLTHLTFNVYELGKHQRPVESQFSYIVVVLSRANSLREKFSKNNFNKYLAQLPKEHNGAAWIIVIILAAAYDCEVNRKNINLKRIVVPTLSDIPHPRRLTKIDSMQIILDQQ